jgi:CRISPR/Cas system CSM-associated protein Csm3 (group 7 of RAMP superfamily)
MALILTLEFSAPVHHGTGDGIAGIIDRACLRDHLGMPYLSGAAIKGKFRYAALRYLKATGDLRCAPQDGHPCRRPPFCQFCELFGSPRIRGRAEFHDAYPEQAQFALIAEQIEGSVSLLASGPAAIRACTAIDRSRRISRREHLFTTEVIVPGVRFQSQISGPLRSSDVNLLRACARLLTHFGADSARGLGFCRYLLRDREAG